MKVVEDITDRLDRMEKKLRRKVLKEIGRDIAAVILPAMKSETRRRTGGLIKSYATKVKTYRRDSTVAAIIGPRTKVVFSVQPGGKRKRVKAKEFYRDPKNRQWKFKREAGVKYYRPSKIAHLAGPGRQSQVLRATIARTRAKVRRVIQEHLARLPDA